MADGRHRSDRVAAEFGSRLYIARRERGYSQEELGSRAGLHRTEVGMLENGQRLARVDTLLKLAQALECDPSRLLHGIEVPA